MGTIVNTMIQGLTEQMVQARLNRLTLRASFSGNTSPLRKSTASTGKP